MKSYKILAVLFFIFGISGISEIKSIYGDPKTQNMLWELIPMGIGITLFLFAVSRYFWKKGSKSNSELY